MRMFYLVRKEDPTGISGTGVVAEGIEFSDRTVALRWVASVSDEAWEKGVRPTTVFHENIKSVEALHGHGGHTVVEFTESDLSTSSVDGKQLTWKEVAERERQNSLRLHDAQRLLADLDRSPNGRHQGDVEGQDPTGFSQGNPHLTTGATIGYDIGGKPYVVPEPRMRGNIDAWQS